MLNKVVIMGRITHEPELKHTPSGVAVMSFNIAVDRPRRKDEEQQADFITCVAWREKALFIQKYFGKGRLIIISGELRSRTYEDKNATKHYVTEVYVDNVFFSGEKKPEDKAEEADVNLTERSDEEADVSPTEKSAEADVEKADEPADDFPF